MEILAYIKKYQKQKPQRNITKTNRYLKENDLLAIQFDKGIGIEKVVPYRKHTMQQIHKEEERIIDILKDMKSNGEIEESLYNQIKQRGGQPARLYGLAKVHITDTPMSPVLSIPGSAYHKIAKKVTKWLYVIDNAEFLHPVDLKLVRIYHPRR